MIFNGRDITTFWFAKALKFDTTYHCAFERQEVTSRGLIRSYLEVPTVRTIVVSLLVRDRNKFVLDERIHEIADWLLSAGEAKLFCDRNDGRYFMARCTDIGIPKFAGTSATFDVTFTCSDYRPYDALTNRQIGNATTDLSNFTFNGKHCLNDMHCLFVMDSITAIPSVNRNAYTIAGRDGTIRYDDEPATLNENALQGSLYFLDAKSSTALMTPQDIAKRQHDVANWLINAKRARLILDSDTGRYYDAEVIDQSDLSYDKWANGMIKLKMVLQPYSTDVTPIKKSAKLTYTSAAYQPMNLADVVTEIGYTTPMIIDITNSGTAAVTDLKIEYVGENGKTKTMQLNGAGFSLAAKQKITINALTYDVLLGTASSLKFIKAGDFPVLTAAGNKQIRIYSNAATTLDVAVTLNRRWL